MRNHTIRKLKFLPLNGPKTVMRKNENRHIPKAHQRPREAKCVNYENKKPSQAPTSSSSSLMKNIIIISLPTRGLWTTDHVILNHGQVTWTTPELAPLSPSYHTTPTRLETGWTASP
ncbi:hypothetical protein TNCV_2867841 [Trichonephila clavipes]|nr:hypothetical protein TNCV_2867841 [Trichonephila clavipes]